MGNAEFDAICELYGDTHYNYDNSQPGIPGDPVASMNAISEAIVSIDISDDVAFDATHPAGSSLADIVTFNGNTPWPFIRSGYAINVEQVHSHWRNGFSSIYKKPLDNLTRDDTTLLHPVMIFNFPAPYLAPGPHNFTITIRTTEKVVSGTISITLPQ